MAEDPSPRWDVAEEHLDEAAFLWAQWEASIVAPGYTLDEVARGPEGRLLAHIDALVLGGGPVARRLLGPGLWDDRGDIAFASAFALLLSEESARLDKVLVALQQAEPEQQAAIRRALMLAPDAGVEQHLPALMASASPAVQATLLDVVAAHRRDPGIPLDILATSGDAVLERSALRAARLFVGRLDAGVLREALGSSEPDVQISAIETGLVLGVPEAWHACEHLLASRGEGWAGAALLAALGGDTRDAPALLEALAVPELRRSAIWALGFSGWPAAADAFVELMHEPSLAPLAAEAFSAVTGLPLLGRFVEPDAAWHPAAPDEAEDDSGPESDLPRPAVEQVERWWWEVRRRFDPSRRYLAGKPWSAEGLLQGLAECPMRRRHALALELAIRTRGAHQLATDVLTARQRHELAVARRAPGDVKPGGFRELLRRGAAVSWPSPIFEPAPPPKARAVPRSRDAVVLTALGMVSAVGHGAVESYAAMRARLSRPWPLPFRVLSSDEMGTRAVTGHPIRGLTDGFTGMARLVRLGALALEDLLRPAALSGAPAGLMQETFLLVCLSPSRREEWDFYDELLAEGLPRRLVERTGLSLPPERTAVVARGHAAGLAAVEQALGLLRVGMARRVLVVGLDSLVEPATLEWLAGHGRLKSPEDAVGLMPGEAGVAVLLETEAEARKRQAAVLACVEAVATGRADAGVPRGAVTGRALSEVIRRVWSPGFPMEEVYGDLNGEPDRAMEWGCALAELRADWELEGMEAYFPAEVLGDTGAASGLVALGAAARAFARGYAQSQAALVWSSADSGEVAAARLSRA